MEEMNERIDQQGIDLFNRGVLSSSVDGHFGDWYRDIRKFNDYILFTIVRNP
jgi:hypothetical protein